MKIEFDYFTPGQFNFFGLEIRFYSICILIGALGALWFSRTLLAKLGYKKDKIDLVFLVAFPSGVLGARLWYVIAQWGVEFSFSDFGQVFNFARGGLAVQGGVIVGVIAGIITLMVINREYSYLIAADAAVPTILFAQAVGRLGNFFNHEVYGKCVSRSSLGFLPDFIVNNVASPGTCGVGQAAVPLFLIEGSLNITAFFLIHFLVRKFYTKTRFYRNGDFVAFYFIWYGVLRSILEPLRSEEFIMVNTSSNIQISSIMSLAFIIAGVLIFLLLRVKKWLPTKTKLVLFDLDGTIIDNNQFIINGYRYLFNKYLPHYQLTKEEELYFLGSPLDKVLKQYFTQNSKELIEEYRDYHEEECKDIKLFLNAEEILKDIKSKNIKIGLVTTKARKVAIKNLKQVGIKDYFDVIIGYSDVKNPKPSSEGIRKAIKQCNQGVPFFSSKRIHVFNTVFIGDSVTDIIAGKRGLVKTIGVNWSLKIEQLKGITPDYIINDFTEVGKIIK